MSLTKCPHCDDQHACHGGDSHTATVATENILFYIGWRAGKLTEMLPLLLRPVDIQVPARHVIALIKGEMTLDEVLAEAGESL